MCRSVICAGLALWLTGLAQASNWPGWRGPRGDGVSDETGIPIRWSQDNNVTWKTTIPGKGHSSPIVWGDRIFLTSCVEEKRVLLCVDRRDGKILWQQDVVTAKLERLHKLNSHASSTPATDGKHVWVSFLAPSASSLPATAKGPGVGGDVQVACYDFDGKQVWLRSPGAFYSVHGFCSPPILYKDTVILNCDQDHPKAFVVALDKATGAERWRIARPGIRSYCPPLIVDAAGKKQMVLSGSKCIASYDPDTGKQWWIIDGPTEQFVASLIYHDNLFFMTAGFPTYHIMGIKPDGEGNVTKSHVLWHVTKTQAYVPSPIGHDKLFFMVNDNGVASCWETQSGKNQWTERLGRHHSASPVYADGHLYFLDDDGTTFVLKPTSKFEVVSKNSLGDEAYASPAISDGQLFVRTLHYLYCIGPAKRASR